MDRFVAKYEISGSENELCDQPTREYRASETATMAASKIYRHRDSALAIFQKPDRVRSHPWDITTPCEASKLQHNTNKIKSVFMNDTKIAAIDRGKKLIKYVCETANITQTQLAEAIGYSQQNLQNKMSRGTVPVPLIQQFMADRYIELPAWAETSGESVEELANQISTLQNCLLYTSDAADE